MKVLGLKTHKNSACKGRCCFGWESQSWARFEAKVGGNGVIYIEEPHHDVVTETEVEQSKAPCSCEGRNKLTGTKLLTSKISLEYWCSHVSKGDDSSKQEHSVKERVFRVRGNNTQYS